MAGAPRLLIQLAILGARIVGRAALNAYRQQSVRAKGPRVNLAPNKLGLDEAYRILNTRAGLPPTEIESSFKRLYAINSPKNGGTFFLQSQIVRAMEVILKGAK